MKHEFKTFRGKPAPAGGVSPTPSTLPAVTEDRVREIIKEEVGKSSFWATVKSMLGGEKDK